MVFWKKKSSSVNGDFLEGREVVDECDVDLGMPRPAGCTNQSCSDFMAEKILYVVKWVTLPRKALVLQMAGELRGPSG